MRVLVHGQRVGSPETAPHWAASSDDVIVLDALLEHGADIEATGAVFTDGTAMSDAVVFAQWRAARRLLDRGVGCVAGTPFMTLFARHSASTTRSLV